MRLPLYIYSTKNLAGCTLAIASVALYLSGVIGDFWWEITTGAYGVGALIAPGTTRIDQAVKQQMNDAEIVASLQRIAARALRLLPNGVAQDVVAICVLLEALIPVVAGTGSADETAYDVRAAATDYLPQTLDSYLRLPPAFRAVARASDGKSADAMLAEQVALLRAKLDELSANVGSADAAKIAANGRFLRERFARTDLREAF